MAMRKGLGFNTFRYIVIVVWCLIVLFPISWMVITSVKPQPEWVVTPIVWWPQHPTMNNWLTVFAPDRVPFDFQSIVVQKAAFKPFIDSLIVSVSGTAVALVIGTLTAYSISRYATGGDFLPFNILSVRMFPPLAALIPILVMFSTLKMLDTYWVLILCYAGFTSPFVVWLMRSFIDEIPKDLEDAAVIDGTSNFGAFLKIVLPLVKGGLAVTALFVFILVWSDFVFALTLTKQNVTTLPLQLSLYQSATAGQLYGPQSALGIAATVPVVIFGLAIQRYLVRGLTFGAIKR
ncbi:MAG: carbohydrate ABC transporter permease [Chloroflexi bacterium]|nr:carbohydrate ABC transporter permease [Chloroflexota bacterium]